MLHFYLIFRNFSFSVAFSLFKYLGAGICIGDACFWSFIVQSECFSFFLRSPQVDGLLWSWDRGVAFGGPIVVPDGERWLLPRLQVSGAALAWCL